MARDTQPEDCAQRVEGCGLSFVSPVSRLTRALRGRSSENERRQHIADAMDRELAHRDEWYGLDNWSTREVVDFVLDRYPRVGEQR